MSDKPNCHKCVHRRDLYGNAHSRCAHPVALAIVAETPMARLAEFFPAPPFMPRRLGVTAVQHGIDRGWFCWPVSFDPTWLLTCDGFTAKEPAP